MTKEEAIIAIEKKYPILNIDDAGYDYMSNAAHKFARQAALFGLGLANQWIDFNKDSDLPSNTFIGCTRGGWVGEVEVFNGKVYRLTDSYNADPVHIYKYQHLPIPPTQDK